MYKKANTVTTLKEQQSDINAKIQAKGCSMDIEDNGNNTGAMAIWRIEDVGISFEMFDIVGVSSSQIEIKDDDKMIESSLYLKDIPKWIFNRVNRKNT